MAKFFISEYGHTYIYLMTKMCIIIMHTLQIHTLLCISPTFIWSMHSWLPTKSLQTLSMNVRQQRVSLMYKSSNIKYVWMQSVAATLILPNILQGLSFITFNNLGFKVFKFIQHRITTTTFAKPSLPTHAYILGRVYVGVNL